MSKKHMRTGIGLVSSSFCIKLFYIFTPAETKIIESVPPKAPQGVIFKIFFFVADCFI